MGHDTRHWAPLVVDIPTAPFEPRPPAPQEYRPDTICDGWSNQHFVVRLASVRGYAHRHGGVSRQDAVEVRSHPGTGAVAFAVADGVSSAPRSDVGAAVACETAMIETLCALDRDPRRIDWTKIIHSIADRMCRVLGDDRQDVTERHATTLVAGALLPRSDGAVGTVVQVGDSAAWLLRDRRFSTLLEHKMTRRSMLVSSAVDPLPRLPDEVVPVGFDLPPDTVLLVGTDGFGDPLGDGTGLVGELFADVLSAAPPPLGLAHALDFSRETFDDDRTLVAIWPASRLNGPP